MTDKQIEDAADGLGKTLAQIVHAIDSLAFAIAAQKSIDAPRLARQLKRELKVLKSGNELAKTILLKMERSVVSVAKKRGRRARGISKKS
jgi:hypothetical protein